jgi:hypothetical protein
MWCKCIFILFEQIEIERFVRTTNSFVTTSCDGVQRRIGQTFHHAELVASCMFYRYRSPHRGP